QRQAHRRCSAAASPIYSPVRHRPEAPGCGPYPALWGYGNGREKTVRRGGMVENNCVFCRIIGGEEMVSLVHEDEQTLCFLDIQPMSKGHTLIVTKDHYETLFDMPEQLAAHCLMV